MEYHIDDSGIRRMIRSGGKEVGEVRDNKVTWYGGKTYVVDGVLTLTCTDEHGKVVGTCKKSLLNKFWDAGRPDRYRVLGKKFKTRTEEEHIIIIDRHGAQVLAYELEDDGQFSAWFTSEETSETRRILLSLAYVGYDTDKRISE